MITGYPAITFNAAGLSWITKGEISTSISDFWKNISSSKNSIIDAYIVNGEILNTTLGPLGLGADGNVHKISVDYFSLYRLDITGIAKHTMGAVKNALENGKVK